MRRIGHYGVALCCYAPVGWAVAAARAEALALLGGATVVALAMLPDLDARVPLLPHRGPTHSLAFAVVAGLGVGLTAAALPATLPGVDATDVGRFGAFVGALAVLSHLLADALTPAGVPLLWPVSGRRFSLGLWSAGSTTANWGLFGLGLVATAVALGVGRVVPT